MTDDDTPAMGTPDRGRDERIRSEQTIGREQPAPGAGDESAGLEQRFEREAAEGVEAAERDTASLEQEAAALREDAAQLGREVPGPDADG